MLLLHGCRLYADNGLVLSVIIYYTIRRIASYFDVCCNVKNK